MLRTSIEGLDALRVRLDKIKDNTANLDPALLRAGAAVLKSAKQHIDYGGDPAWKPNLSGTPLLRKTNVLYNSLTEAASGNVTETSGAQIRVGTNVYYARWLQDGTGVYGTRGSPITSTDKKALKFKIGGKVVYAKSVKGVPKRPYLYFDEQNTRAVARIFGDWVLAKDTEGTP